MTLLCHSCILSTQGLALTWIQNVLRDPPRAQGLPVNLFIEQMPGHLFIEQMPGQIAFESGQAFTLAPHVSYSGYAESSVLVERYCFTGVCSLTRLASPRSSTQ